MAIVVTAPETTEAKGFKVFLAGAIDMGQAEDWQAMVINTMADIDNVILFNPRRKEFTADTLVPQIEWELEALENADVIFMWLPSTSKAPVSMFEAGLYLKSGKLILGAGSDFYRRTNLEITALRYCVAIFDSLQQMYGRLLTMMEKAGYTP